MRVILIGTPDDRGRLRSRLGESVEIVAETATLSEARRVAADDEVDAFVVAATRAVDDEEAPPDPLTPREIEVLSLVADGLIEQSDRRAAGHQPADREVPRRLDPGKLGAANRTDAARRAIQRGIVAV